MSDEKPGRICAELLIMACKHRKFIVNPFVGAKEDRYVKLLCFLYAGIKEADVDPDTGMYRIALDLDEEKVDTVIANIIECVTGTDWARITWGGQWGANATPAFTEGRVLFFDEVAHQIDNIGDIDFSLGVVPFPKLNEEQENYSIPVTKVQATFICIPKCSVSKEMSCYFVDVLAWTGSETIMEAYYDKFEAKMDIETAEEDMEINMQMSVYRGDDYKELFTRPYAPHW